MYLLGKYLHKQMYIGNSLQVWRIYVNNQKLNISFQLPFWKIRFRFFETSVSGFERNRKSIKSTDFVFFDTEKARAKIVRIFFQKTASFGNIGPKFWRGVQKNKNWRKTQKIAIITSLGEKLFDSA
jgi:hypothetical protein